MEGSSCQSECLSSPSFPSPPALILIALVAPLPEALAIKIENDLSTKGIGGKDPLPHLLPRSPDSSHPAKALLVPACL